MNVIVFITNPFADISVEKHERTRRQITIIARSHRHNRLEKRVGNFYFVPIQKFQDRERALSEHHKKKHTKQGPKETKSGGTPGEAYAENAHASMNIIQTPIVEVLGTIVVVAVVAVSSHQEASSRRANDRSTVQ